MLKKRPRLRLKHAPVRSGARADVVLVVDADRAVAIDSLELVLEATESAHFYQYTERRTLFTMAARPEDKATIPPGRFDYPCRFALPAGMPPSYSGRRYRVEYSYRARADIPWWPDARGVWTATVAPAEVDARPTPPLVTTTSRARPAEPWLEVSLGTTTVELGGHLEGALAIGNLEVHRVRRIELALVAYERIACKHRDEEHEVLRQRATGPAVADGGRAAPFVLAVPRQLPPTFRGALGGLRWMLEVRADVALRRDLRVAVPLTLLFPAAAPRARPRLVAPLVGAERSDAVWQALAAELGLHAQGQTISGALSGAALHVSERQDGALAAELRFPSLRMELSIEPRTSLLRRAQPLQPDHRGRARAYHVRARDAEQAAHLLRALREATHQLPPLDIDDEAARCLLPPGPANDHERVRWFLRGLADLAAALAAARASIPVPAVFTSREPAWRELAETLGGPLETTRMAIAGSRHGLHAEVRTEWLASGEPDCTVVELRPSHPLRQVERSQLPPEALALVGKLERGTHALLLGADALAVALPAPLARAAPALALLDTLAELARMLAAGAGPYR